MCYICVVLCVTATCGHEVLSVCSVRLRVWVRVVGKRVDVEYVLLRKRSYFYG